MEKKFLRFPARIRGVIAGLGVLAASPALVISFAPGTAAHTASVTPARADVAVQSGRFTPMRIPEIAAPEATPAPTAAPTAAPTPVAKPKPTATPKPAAPVVAPPPAAAAGSVQAIIIAAAERHGVSASWMLKIAACESGYRTNAYNPAGPYIGLFQFLPSTFRAHGGTDIYDAGQQSEITATMLAAGQSRAWGCA